MGVRVNYVIGTYAYKENRYMPDDVSPLFEDYLKIHLNALQGTDLSHTDQITIMQPIAPCWENEFYNIDDIKLPCPVVKVQCKNEFGSYGQYLKAFELFRDLFDYYIFIEDDYYVANRTFKADLISLFSGYRDAEPEDSIYLCTLTGYEPITLHARISNGITDLKSLVKISSGNNVRDILSRGIPQVSFSILFDTVVDYSTKYQATYWSSMHKRIFLFYKPDLIDETDIPLNFMFHPMQWGHGFEIIVSGK